MAQGQWCRHHLLVGLILVELNNNQTNEAVRLAKFTSPFYLPATLGENFFFFFPFDWLRSAFDF